MTDEPNGKLRERARRALERSLRSAAPPRDEPPDPEPLTRLEAALQSLPARQREISLAVRLDDAGYAELAPQTGLSAKRVEREFARALLLLHRALNDRRRISWWRRFWRS